MTNEAHSTKLVGVFSPVGTDGMSGTHTQSWDGPRSERGEREGKREEEGDWGHMYLRLAENMPK